MVSRKPCRNMQFGGKSLSGSFAVITAARPLCGKILGFEGVLCWKPSTAPICLWRVSGSLSKSQVCEARMLASWLASFPGLIRRPRIGNIVPSGMFMCAVSAFPPFSVKVVVRCFHMKTPLVWFCVGTLMEVGLGDGSLRGNDFVFFLLLCRGDWCCMCGCIPGFIILCLFMSKFMVISLCAWICFMARISTLPSVCSRYRALGLWECLIWRAVGQCLGSIPLTTVPFVWKKL